jgi:hypothetical protein
VPVSYRVVVVVLADVIALRYFDLVFIVGWLVDVSEQAKNVSLPLQELFISCRKTMTQIFKTIWTNLLICCWGWDPAKAQSPASNATTANLMMERTVVSDQLLIVHLFIQNLSNPSSWISVTSCHPTLHRFLFLQRKLCDY